VDTSLSGIDEPVAVMAGKDPELVIRIPADATIRGVCNHSVWTAHRRSYAVFLGTTITIPALTHHTGLHNEEVNDVG